MAKKRKPKPLGRPLGSLVLQPDQNSLAGRLAYNLRAIQREWEWTVKDMYRYCKISRSTYYELLAGDGDQKAGRYLVQLAETLEVSIAKLTRKRPGRRRL